MKYCIFVKYINKYIMDVLFKVCNSALSDDMTNLNSNRIVLITSK